MVVAYVAPSNPLPADGIPQWAGLPSTWTGPDGDVWPITDRQQGVFLRPGVRGLHMPEFQRHSSQSPAVAGSRHKGTSTLDREVFWPLTVFHHAGSQAWMERDRAFWASLDPDREGTWEVRHPDGQTRSIQCRFLTSESASDHNPFRIGWQKYGVTLLADQPYWAGPKFQRRWTVSDPVDVYDSGPAIYTFSSSAELSTATMTNEGDVPAFPVWTIAGPTTTVQVGVEGKIIDIPFPIADGKGVEIDTHPVHGQIAWYGDYLNGEVVNRVDRTAELGEAAFVAIPPGQHRELSLAMNGTGSVISAITPLYRRAW